MKECFLIDYFEKQRSGTLICVMPRKKVHLLSVLVFGGLMEYAYYALFDEVHLSSLHSSWVENFLNYIASRTSYAMEYH